MFIAQSRFRVYRGREYDFESRWQEREAYLSSRPGFVALSLLRNWLGDDTVEYVSQSTWRCREDFDASRDGQPLDYRRYLGGVIDGRPEIAVYETVMPRAEQTAPSRSIVAASPAGGVE